MNVIVLQLFVSLMLVVSSVLLFAISVKQRDHDHADRLSLFPLEQDDPAAENAARGPSTSLSPAHPPFDFAQGEREDSSGRRTS